MKVNKDSNFFTFLFAGIMVVFVGLLLSSVDVSLKPLKKENLNNEKMQNIVQTIIEEEVSRDEAKLKFNKMITKTVILDYNKKKVRQHTGQNIIKDKSSGFYVDLLKEYKSMEKEKRNYPLFISESNGNSYYIIPLMGSGLWGPVWGYIAFDKDFNIIGAIFDHKGETPGLGAEIRYKKFQEQFKGKNILDANGVFQSVKVLKGGASTDDIHGVDGITGGTITSDGVTEMLERTLQVYVPYIKGDI